jgi:glyoxylase-like metal-dependent hydrolase (beta-lactamase superfamily II)
MQPLTQLGQRFGGQAVYAPAALRLVGHQPGVTQYLEVLGDGGAAELESVAEFPGGQGLPGENLKQLPPHRVSQRRENVADALASGVGRGHDRQYMSEKPDMSTISDTFVPRHRGPELPANHAVATGRSPTHRQRWGRAQPGIRRGNRRRRRHGRIVLTHQRDAASFLFVHYDWEQLTGSVHRCRLPFCDVTIGLVRGGTGALVVDSGTTLVEAAAVDADIRQIAGRRVTHVVLTHKHFDHVLGSSQFAEAEFYCAPEVVEYLSSATDQLRGDALSYGADAREVDRAIAALRPPPRGIYDAVIDLGGRTVTIAHLGRGHTTADLVVVAPAPDDEGGPVVVFTGDLVEESADPYIDADSDLPAWPATLDRLLAIGGSDAIYVPGHGNVVDAEFVRRQRDWLRERAGCEPR